MSDGARSMMSIFYGRMAAALARRARRQRARRAAPRGYDVYETADESSHGSHRRRSRSPAGLEIEPIERRPRAMMSNLVLERQTEVARLEPVDAQDVGAHVGEQHAAEWPGPDAGQLEDLHAGQRTAHPRDSIVRNIGTRDRALITWPLGDLGQLEFSLTPDSSRARSLQSHLRKTIKLARMARPWREFR